MEFTRWTSRMVLLGTGPLRGYGATRPLPGYGATPLVWVHSLVGHMHACAGVA